MRRHFIIKKDSNIPLVGVNVFGIIDRGTNLLQVRSVSGCPLNCIYCSVEEGSESNKPNTYQVETEYLVQEFNKIVEYKGISDVEAHIDSMGEPLMDRNAPLLVKMIRENKNVKTISMQTNGALLNNRLVEELASAGLDRLNLSINTFNPATAQLMSGVPNYDVTSIKRMAELIVKKGVKLLIAPVVVPGYNDKDVGEIIMFAKKHNALLGIQKYEKHKYARRLKVKEWTWYEYNKRMKSWEKEYDYKLLLSKSDFNIHPARMLPLIFKKGEKITGKVVLPGWLRNEVIIKVKDRLVTVFNSDNEIGDNVKARIVKTKHNLYLAEKVTR